MQLDYFLVTPKLSVSKKGSICHLGPDFQEVADMVIFFRRVLLRAIFFFTITMSA